MCNCLYLLALIALALKVREAESNHLSQIGNRVSQQHSEVARKIPSHKQSSQRNSVPFHSSHSSFNSWKKPTQSSPPESNSINLRITNNNINDNINSGNNHDNRRTSFSSRRQSPISFSVNHFIHQQFITRQILLQLLKKKLFDANGRYTQDINRRGANFLDPRSILRPKKTFPNLNSGQPKQSPGSLIIESTGAISVTEIKKPNGETQIVIDTTSKGNKSKNQTVPQEDPPEIENPTG